MFLDGERFDFSQDQFMSLEPCLISHRPSLLIPSAHAHGEGLNLKEAVHLHNNNGDNIHVHIPGVTYHDFFLSLNMKFEDDYFLDHRTNAYRNNETHSFRFFINGEEIDTIADREIRDLDQTLITYGPRDRDQTSIDQELLQLTNNACFYSEACKHRGEAYAENCGGASKLPLLLKWMGIKE